jgi:hypothetical protein
MSESPWLALRQAEEAVANHRPEDAHRLIEPLIADGYRKASRLAREVVKAYVARAAKFLDQNNLGAAWGDLLAAEALNTGEKAVAELRQTLARLGLVQARASLEAGEPLDTVATVGRLRERGVRHPDLAHLEAVAQDWGQAAELVDRGEFLRAIADLDRLRPKLPCPTTGFDRFRGEVEERHARFRASVGRLYDAAEARLWRDALAAADEVLAVAPEHREAKAIRGKAWLAAAPLGGEPENARAEGESTGPAVTRPDRGPNLVGTASTLDYSSPSTPQTLTSSHAGSAPFPKRFLLWVDGVGGYLVCLSNRVTFGQATGEAPVDVPLFADVSRLHAELTRDGEGYVIESGKGVLVNGKTANRSVLAAGDRVTLGATCQFLFHKPVSVSSTARLELTSGHRLPVAVDGVLLMGNELILGAGPESHVVLPGVPAPVLIYRSKDGLGVRVPDGRFRIDDRVCHDRAALPLPSVVSADTFTFAVEPVSGRL